MCDRVIRAARDSVALAGLLLNFARRAIRWRSVSLAWWALQYDAVEARERRGGNV